MKELIEYLIKHLVDKPENVFVDEIVGEHTVIYEIHVGDGDMGKVIGKCGKTANSLRTILAAVSAKQGKRAVLEILETKSASQNALRHKKPANEKGVQKNIPAFQSTEKQRWPGNGGSNF